MEDYCSVLSKETLSYPLNLKAQLCFLRSQWHPLYFEHTCRSHGACAFIVFVQGTCSVMVNFISGYIIHILSPLRWALQNFNLRLVRGSRSLPLMEHYHGELTLALKDWCQAKHLIKSKILQPVKHILHTERKSEQFNTLWILCHFKQTIKQLFLPVPLYILEVKSNSTYHIYYIICNICMKHKM